MSFVGPILGGAPATGTAQTILNAGTALQKVGKVLAPGAGWEAGRIDSPSIILDPISGRRAMLYVGYDAGITEAQIGLAFSDDLLTWTKYAGNPVLGPSGAGPDSAGTTGPVCYYDAATGLYHLFYIGLTAAGYEGGVPSLCLATAPALTGPWTRKGQIIGPSGTGWRSGKVFHPSVIELNGLYYLFFNAADGAGVESIGYAKAASLGGPWSVDDVNSPVLAPTGNGADWDGSTVGDPSVFVTGPGAVAMAYYGKGAAGKGQDGLAFTSLDAFPVGWTRYPDNPVLAVGPTGSFDDADAHKPFMVPQADRTYHYYTAISSGGAWSFGLAIGERLPYHGCALYSAHGQAIPNNVAGGTALTFDTVIHDTDGYHSSGTPSRLTCPAGLGGNYRLTYNTRVPGNATGVRILFVSKNGGAVGIPGAARGVNAPSAADFPMDGRAELELGAGDYVEVRFFQTSGGNLTVGFEALSDPGFCAAVQLERLDN